MKVARLYSRDDIRIEEIDAPEPDEGEILVQTRACGICTGDIMGWYMERKAPLVFGHEPSGVVAAVGPGVAELSVGDRVFVHHHAPCGRCRHCNRGAYVHCKTWRSTGLRPGGMAEYFAVPAANVAADTLRLPDSVSFEAGSLIEPAACVVKSLRRGGLQPSDVVVVVGLGVMGQLHVALAANAGARVIAADLVPFRLERALELGAEAVVDVSKESLAEGVAARNDGVGGDLVIVGPGSIEAMESGIESAAPGGRVVLFTTSQPDDRLSVSPFRIYFDEVSLIPSYSCGPDDTREALKLIVDGCVPVDRLVTHRFGLESVIEAMDAAGRVDEALKAVVLFE